MRRTWTLQAVLAIVLLAAGCHSAEPNSRPPAALGESEAQTLKDKVQFAAHSMRWNDALDGVKQIDELCKDDAVRQSIGFDALLAETVTGRDRWFRREVPSALFRQMEALIAAKVRDKSSAATLAAACDWVIEELPTEIRKRVCEIEGLTNDEVLNYWKARASGVRKVSYGTGSFIVVEKSQPDVLVTTGERPWTEDEWWRSAGSLDRSFWLTAYFVEMDGSFEILRDDETDCLGCRGSGTIETLTANGAEPHLCVQCNGCGKFRSVVYR